MWFGWLQENIKNNIVIEYNNNIVGQVGFGWLQVNKVIDKSVIRVSDFHLRTSFVQKNETFIWGQRM